MHPIQPTVVKKMNEYVPSYNDRVRTPTHLRFPQMENFREIVTLDIAVLNNFKKIENAERLYAYLKSSENM